MLFSEPPCTKAIEDIPTLLISGVPRPVPGFFVPKCNEDGFYVSKQCNDKECFCVDRNGLEVPETRIKGKNLLCRTLNFSLQFVSSSFSCRLLVENNITWNRSLVVFNFLAIFTHVSLS